MLISYTYDDNGNLLSQLDVNNTAIVRHSYNGFNQLVSSVTGDGTITYTYNAQGIRTSRTIGQTTTHYLLDGGNVIGEVTGDETYTYVRGVNLIFGRARYYLYNAHGDVVQLTNTNGELTKNYNYDAFGNERAPSEDDVNPFRYCGEYYDTETGLYYLRARYYDPLIGRFTQEDTHWNTANMIYGDNPQKINEREDALGLKTYSYTPQILSIVQSGNLYMYCVNNPVAYCDKTGNFLCWAVGALVGAAFGALGAAMDGKSGRAFWGEVIGGAVSGGIAGAAADLIMITGGGAALVIGVFAFAGGAGGALGEIVGALVEKTDINTAEVVQSGIFGALFGALCGAVAFEGVLQPLAKIAASKGRSIGEQIVKMIVKELSALPISVLEEVLSNIASLLLELIYDIAGVNVATAFGGIES